MAEPDYLYDTGVLIDIYHGRERVRPYFERLLRDDLGVFLSVITEAELWRGLRPGELEAHDALLSRFVRVPVNSAVAQRAGQWMQQYQAQGLGWLDALIVATAVSAEALVLTQDRRLAAVLDDEAEFALYG